VAFTALAAIAVIVAALLLATGEPKVALTSRRPPLHLPAPPAGPSVPAGTGHRVQAAAAAPVEWILLFVAIAALGFSVWLWLRWRRPRPPIASPGSHTPS
jgi:multisubunit Na+/H+ antiporter MnhB subunit